MADYFIRFVNHLDPNGPSPISNPTINNGSIPELHWPQYDLNNPQLLTFLDGDVAETLTPDTYRKEGMDLLTSVNLSNP